MYIYICTYIYIRIYVCVGCVCVCVHVSVPVSMNIKISKYNSKIDFTNVFKEEYVCKKLQILTDTYLFIYLYFMNYSLYRKMLIVFGVN